MKSSTLLLGVPLLSLMIAGCAATPSSMTRTTKVDAARVAAVESAARSQGVTVIWVNAPRVEDSP